MPAALVSRGSRVACALAIPVGAASWFHPDADGSDLWWHLSAGRLIWERAEVPRSDPFSHTAVGEPWINHEWLWDLLAWGTYRIHPDALAWAQLLLLVGVFTLTAWSAQRLGKDACATLAATWLAAAASHWFLDVRPHVATLFLVSVLLATREARWAPGLWPPLVALWANLHAGFVFGIGLIGLHTLLGSWSALRAGTPLPRARWLGLGLAILAAGLNPWGPALYALPLETLEPDTPFRDLIEWYPAQLSLDPRTYGGRFAWLAIAAAAGLWRARREPFWIALALVTAAMALAARRFIPLFAVCAAPVAALGIAAALSALRRRLPAPRSRWTPVAAAVAAWGVALLLWGGVRFAPQPLLRWTRGDSFPAGAVAALARLEPRPTRLFQSYTWGGFVLLHAPGIPIFIDGRAGTVYPDGLARRYLALAEARPGWRRMLRAHAVDAVLVEPSSPLLPVLQRLRPAWRVAYADPLGVLLLPPSGDATSRRPQTPDGEGSSRLALGFDALRRGEIEAAERELAALARADPLQIQAYRGLMLAAARRGDIDAVERWTRDALSAHPRRRDAIWMAAANAYRAVGDSGRELAALRRVRVHGPFVRPADARAHEQRLRALEARVSHEGASTPGA
jgi:hypothetical protein